MCAILEHLAALSLSGDLADLKESRLGVTLFHREPGYDTQADPIVRVSIRRLRHKLQQFHAGMEREESCRIEIPVGAYVVTFRPGAGPITVAGPSPARAARAEHRALSCCPGNPCYPAFCADGNRLAFQWRSRNDDLEGIYVQHMGDDSPVRFSPSDRTELRPVWSPDSSRIAFLQAAGSTRFLLVSRPVSGGAEQSFGSLGANRGEVPRVDWSADGAWLLTSERSHPHLPMRLLLIDAHTGERRGLTAPPETVQGDSEGVFSPDSRRIAFCRCGAYSGGDLFLLDSIEGEEPHQVTFQDRPTRGLCWGADGHTLIAALCLHGSSPTLWRVPLDGSAPRRFSDQHHRIQSPAAAPRCGAIAYVEQDVESRICATPIGSGGRSAVVDESLGLNRLPQFSPDDSLIAFCSDRNGDDQIWTSGPQGQILTRLTTLPQAAIGALCWSPAGDAICFESHSGGSAGIVSVDLSTLALRALSPPGMRAISPAWSADGRWLYFASDRQGIWQIWRISADGGEPRRITANGGIKALESPDGQFLYYSKGPVYGGLWRKHLKTGQVEMLPWGPSTDMWANWTVGAQGVYWLRSLEDGEAGATDLVLAGWDGEVKPVARLLGPPAGADAGLSISSSGHTLLTAEVDHCTSRIIVTPDAS